MNLNKFQIRIDKFDLLFSFISAILIIGMLMGPVHPSKLGDENFHRETRNLVNIIYGDLTYADLYVEKAVGPDFYYFIPYSFAFISGTDEAYWVAGVIWNSLIMIISTVLFKHAVTTLFNKKTGIFATVLFLLFPIHLYYALGINGESMVTISICLMLYGVVSWAKDYKPPIKSIKWWYFTVGSIFLILARFNFVTIIPLTMLLIAIAYFRKYDVKFQKGLIYYALILTVISISSRVIVDNLPGTKGKNYQSRYGAYVMHMGRFQFREEPADWRFWDDQLRKGSIDYLNWRNSIDDLDRRITEENPYHSIYNRWVIHDYLTHPWITVKQFMIKQAFGHFFQINSIDNQSFSFGPLKGKTGYNLFHLLLNSLNFLGYFGFIGFLIKYKDKLISDYWYILIILISSLVFYGLTYMEPRYLFPLRVIYMLGASQWLMDFYHSRMNVSNSKTSYIN